MRYDRYNLLAPGSRFKCEGGLDPTDIIGSGLSFIGGLISNNTNKKIAREQMAQQERFFNTQMDYTQQAEQRAYDYADKAWERENAYNDPAAQRARFENAGLNPAMMMQGQNAVVGSMQSVAGGNAAPGAPSPVGYEYHDPITPAVNTYLQSRLLNSQVEKNEQDAYQVQIDNRTRAVKNIGELYEAKSRIELNRVNALKSGKDVDYLDRQIDLINLEIQYQQQTLESRVQSSKNTERVLDLQGNDLVEQIRSKQIDNFFADIEHRLNISLSRAQIKRIKSQIAVDGSQVNLNDAQAKKLAAEYSKTILEAAELSPGSDQWKRQNRLIKAQIYNLLKGKLNLFGLGVETPQVLSNWVFGDD